MASLLADGQAAIRSLRAKAPSAPGGARRRRLDLPPARTLAANTWKPVIGSSTQPVDMGQASVD